MICANCTDPFPSSLWIDGKQHILSSRKYCLDCSPLGGRNTRKLEVPTTKAGHVSTCEICNRDYVFNTEKGNTKRHCNSCIIAKRRTKIKQRLVDLKGGKCQQCGYSRCLDALEFHHRDPSQKSFSVNTKQASIRFERLVEEIAKCDLLCANCHREGHATTHHSRG